jgi:hypothetical protein
MTRCKGILIITRCGHFDLVQSLLRIRKENFAPLKSWITHEANPFTCLRLNIDDALQLLLVWVAEVSASLPNRNSMRDEGTVAVNTGKRHLHVATAGRTWIEALSARTCRRMVA